MTTIESDIQAARAQRAAIRRVRIQSRTIQLPPRRHNRANVKRTSATGRLVQSLAADICIGLLLLACTIALAVLIPLI